MFVILLRLWRLVAFTFDLLNCKSSYQLLLPGRDVQTNYGFSALFDFELGIYIVHAAQTDRRTNRRTGNTRNAAYRRLDSIGTKYLSGKLATCCSAIYTGDKRVVSWHEKTGSQWSIAAENQVDQFAGRMQLCPADTEDVETIFATRASGSGRRFAKPYTHLTWGNYIKMSDLKFSDRSLVCWFYLLAMFCSQSLQIGNLFLCLLREGQ